MTYLFFFKWIKRYIKFFTYCTKKTFIIHTLHKFSVKYGFNLKMQHTIFIQTAGFDALWNYV